MWVLAFWQSLATYCHIFVAYLATALLHIWTTFAAWLQYHDSKRIANHHILMSSLAEMGNIRYILPECINEKYIFTICLWYICKGSSYLKSVCNILVTCCECGMLNRLTRNAYLKMKKKLPGCFLAQGIFLEGKLKFSMQKLIT